MTLEREQEREDFQHVINSLNSKYEDLRRERDKAENIIEQQQMEINELEDHLRKIEIVEIELVNKLQGSEYELKQTIDKVKFILIITSIL